MAISEVTKDLRRLLDAQNMCSYYITSDGVEHGVTSGFPLKLEVSIIYSIDDYAFGPGAAKTLEEILEVLGRYGEK